MVQLTGSGHKDDFGDLGKDFTPPVDSKGAGIRTAVVYRTNAKNVVDEFEQINYRDGDQVQFELCVFSDGRVAHRWLVGNGSCVWWDKLEDLYKVHIYAHPDYGTRVEWSDGKVEEL